MGKFGWGSKNRNQQTIVRYIYEEISRNDLWVSTQLEVRLSPE